MFRIRSQRQRMVGPQWRIVFVAISTAMVSFVQGGRADGPYVLERQLYSMDADGSNLQAITVDEKRFFGSPVWSPDGKSIAYDAWASGSPFWTSHVFTSCA